MDIKLINFLFNSALDEVSLQCLIKILCYSSLLGPLCVVCVYLCVYVIVSDLVSLGISISCFVFPPGACSGLVL